MLKLIGQIWHRILVFLRISPFSLAEKCRFAFGAAIVFILALALLIPYVWMGQLSRKAILDVGATRAQMIQQQHFQFDPLNRSLTSLTSAGSAMDPNSLDTRWIPLTGNTAERTAALDENTRQMLEQLLASENKEQNLQIVTSDGRAWSRYIKLIRANDNCISCHSRQGSGAAFDRRQPVGAVVVTQSASELAKTMMLNRIWLAFAGLIAGAGAIVVFYIITQRVILRPIRQLRALVNNVAEGNLEIRSSIKTHDEYENLADAFNHMLDGLESSQEKLRQANKQLDAKIAELSERNIELFKANKIKGEFLANVSHEFRTPLNAILGFAEILREKAPDAKTRRYAENIITGGQRLLNMINDLLDLAKTEAGKLKLHIEPTDIRRICESLVRSFSMMTREKKIKVRLNINSDIPVLSTDGGKVQQVLYNFMSNAVKFTPEHGRIEIRATMPDDKHVRIAVADTGCGIADEDKEKIFEKFRQADGSLTRHTTGTGLGLAISKELAGMLAGTIGLESQSDQGSIFWLEIPIAITAETEES